MPRQSRIDAPGALHHVLIRGIERRKIFKDDPDRDNFLDRLGRILAETSTACYGWALLANHGHLLLRKGELWLKGDERILGVPVSPAGHRERSNSTKAGVADLRRIG